MYPGLFYRVIAAITKWMAPHNPPQGHEKAPNDTMAFYSINGILRAGGIEATCSREEFVAYVLVSSYYEG